MEGWIRLHRDILDSDVFASQKMLKIWIWCLCKANFKDRTVPLKIGRGETLVKVKRGQFIFGRFKAEEELFIDGSTIYKIMQRLEKMNNIKIQSNNQYSIVTINNYNDYQKKESKEVTTNEQPSNNQVTGNAQPSNTTNKDKKDKKVNNDNNKDGEQDSLFKTMMKVYYDWFEVAYGMKPQIDGGDGKALNTIIAYFKLNCKDDIVIVDSWKLLFEHWNKLSKFYKEQTRIRQISSNIQNIIIELKTNLQKNDYYKKHPELFNADGSLKYGF